jgi:predicted phage baseplate assembly protein
MRLPEIQLDDRRFQDLVSEARRRIARACPEWSEHNVSDPGITLIELFAWMTEMTIYRLNRVPDKLHVQLLQLLGIRLDGPSAAQTDLRFRLSAPPSSPIRIAALRTEVQTQRMPGEDPVVFQVDDDFVVPAMRPAALVLYRGRDYRSVALADGVAHPQGGDQLAFGNPPQVGDAMYLGFEEPLSRLMLQIDMEASQARGAGVSPEDPPLRWEVAQTDAEWAEAEVLEDFTGGFNYGSGTVELQLPATSGVANVAGRRLYWLRCRVEGTARSGAAARYTEPPEIFSITAAPSGALLPSTHASHVEYELIGTSDGTPGQVFSLRYRPLLPPRAGETLEVREPESEEWAPWEYRDSFVDSTKDDPHFAVDLVSGEIELGPAIRENDGRWTRYGAVPPKGSQLRFTRYRYGGGRSGNIAPGTLVQLRTPIAGVASVENPRAATGGVDAERLDSARSRAALEIRSRYRAVTAEDFEFLAGEASPRVARAKCIAPDQAGAVHLHIVPRVGGADRKLEYEELIPSEDLLRTVAGYLDERRLIGTTVQLLPSRYRGLSVAVSVQATRSSNLRRVEEDVAHALYTYLNPLVGGNPVGIGEGWVYGRALNQGELYGIVHAIRGVEFVGILRVYETNLRTGEQAAKAAGPRIVLAPDELIASGTHIVKASHTVDAPAPVQG